MTDAQKQSIANKDIRYARLWNLPHNGVVVPTPVVPPEPCGYAKLLTGKEREANGLDHARVWNRCCNPKLPLGKQFVCPCQGCGPACSGYRIDVDVESPPNTGIVLGHFGMPGLARLHVAAIRRYAGSCPVLIADDGSGRHESFDVIADADPLVSVWPSCERKGHYAGDLSVFWKGLQWAHTTGLTHLVKLSQRFIWTKPNWLATAVTRLVDSGEATMMQQCTDNGVNLYVRTECMILDVAKWLPLLAEFNYVRLSNPTELRIWHLVHSQFAEKYCEWTDLPVNRYQPAPGTVWHGTHTHDDYQKLANTFGIPLDNEFYTDGHQGRPGWVRG